MELWQHTRCHLCSACVVCSASCQPALSALLRTGRILLHCHAYAIDQLHPATAALLLLKREL